MELSAKVAVKVATVMECVKNGGGDGGLDGGKRGNDRGGRGASHPEMRLGGGVGTSTPVHSLSLPSMQVGVKCQDVFFSEAANEQRCQEDAVSSSCSQLTH